MPYKTGTWGDKAKERYQRRKANGYFVRYRKERMEKYPEIIREQKRRFFEKHGYDYLRNYLKRTRAKNKEEFYALKDKCSICGYDKCKWALQYHHLDKKSKREEISNISREYGINSLKFKEEIKKCILVCANCHAELESREEKY